MKSSSTITKMVKISRIVWHELYSPTCSESLFIVYSENPVDRKIVAERQMRVVSRSTYISQLPNVMAQKALLGSRDAKGGGRGGGGGRVASRRKCRSRRRRR